MAKVTSGILLLIIFYIIKVSSISIMKIEDYLQNEGGKKHGNWTQKTIAEKLEQIRVL